MKNKNGSLFSYFRQRALKEYAESAAWYKERSSQVAENFVAAIENSLRNIANSPYANRNSYKQFHEVKTKRFPFKIVYFVDEERQQVVIITIFHQKRNPLKNTGNLNETLAKKYSITQRSRKIYCWQ